MSANLIGLTIARSVADALSGPSERDGGGLFSTSRRRSLHVTLFFLFLFSSCGAVLPCLGASSGGSELLAQTPPMGWNTWAHYQCGYTAHTILANARALVSTGLAARGYNTVTIDDCWMQKNRDASGELQVDRERFPQGIRPVAQAIHALGLKFGIYEDAGFATCGGFAGSGRSENGGKDHFARDIRLFESWDIDLLKLDGCDVYVPPGSSKGAAYREAYAAESAVLKSTGRPIVFSEAAPAFFQGTPEWYDVLGWVRHYGELWGEGTAMSTLDVTRPGRPRFNGVLWNYSYNLPLGRFQKPGNWDHADFVIAGDTGLTLAESRSQMALWSMMSAPLILSSDVGELNTHAVAVLGNKAVIAVDQDSLGRMATLVSRSPEVDVLFKPLSGGEAAVAALNRSAASLQITLHPADFGFAANAECNLDVQDLWTGTRRSAVVTLQAEVAAHDTAIWRIRPSPACGKPARVGAIVTTNNTKRHTVIEGYARCLTAPGSVEACTGAMAERWTVASHGELRSSSGRCLAVVKGRPEMQFCRDVRAQHWRYTLMGNLVSAASHQCLSAVGSGNGPQSLEMKACGHNQLNQVWSLPN